MSSHLIAVFLGCLVGAACLAADRLPEAGELDCERRDPGGCSFTDGRTGLQVRLPSDWPLRRVRIVTFSGPSASALHRGAERVLRFEYLPEEPSNPAALLFEAIVLSHPDWLRLAGGAGPSLGVEVAGNRTHAVVAAATGASPYPAESRDTAIFEALLPSLPEISLILALPGGS